MQICIGIKDFERDKVNVVLVHQVDVIIVRKNKEVFIDIDLMHFREGVDTHVMEIGIIVDC